MIQSATARSVERAARDAVLSLCVEDFLRAEVSHARRSHNDIADAMTSRPAFSIDPDLARMGNFASPESCDPAL
ncbi:MAG: hypothetical protein C4341_09915, partial [Armatimonadota bacterium]